MSTRRWELLLLAAIAVGLCMGGSSRCCGDSRDVWFSYGAWNPQDTGVWQSSRMLQLNYVSSGGGEGLGFVVHGAWGKATFVRGHSASMSQFGVGARYTLALKKARVFAGLGYDRTAASVKGSVPDPPPGYYWLVPPPSPTINLDRVWGPSVCLGLSYGSLGLEFRKWTADGENYDLSGSILSLFYGF